jgi:hypothetical protein
MRAKFTKLAASSRRRSCSCRSFYVEPPAWDQEHREFVERERAVRIAEAQALLEAEGEPLRPTTPAKPKSWCRSTA